MKGIRRHAASVAVFVLLASGSAVAGYQWSGSDIGAFVSGSAASLWGSLGNNHSSSSASKYIGCSVTAVNTAFDAYATCYGKNASGTTVSCLNGNTDAASFVAGEGYFYADISDGYCQTVQTEVASSNPGKSSGAASGYATQVSISGNIAKGALGTVYNTSDDVQYIGCSYRSNGSVTCSAKNNANPPATLSCTSADSVITLAALAIKEDSYIEFTKSSSSSECDRLVVKNDSRYAPRR